MEGLRPAMAEGGKVMAQFNNMKMVRNLGMFALLIVAIIEFAELVALRMEGRISWPAFWKAASIKMGAMLFLLVMFASFMALIGTILVALAPTLGPVLIGGLAIAGSIYLMNWLAKALGMGAVPGEEWDPKPWLDRATNLRQVGFEMASQNIWDDPMTVLAGAITQMGGVAVEGVTRAFMAVNEFDKIGPAINTMFDVDGPDRFAREQGYSNYAAYKKDKQFEKYAHRRERRRSGANTEYRPTKTSKPQQTLLGKSDWRKELRSLKKSRNKTLASIDFAITKGDKPTALKFTKELSKQNAAISLLEGATLNDEGTHYILATTKIINAPSNNISIDKRTNTTTFPGHNISLNDSAVGLYP
jgi:hypothetical protein